MLKTAILIAVITQAWAMPELGRSMNRLRREAASDSSDSCQTAVQCGETFAALFVDNSTSTADQECGYFSSYIDCLDAVVDLCPAVNSLSVYWLRRGKYYLCNYPWKACTVAFPCATDFMNMYTGNFGQAGSDDCSNAMTYKNCLNIYDDSCPWIRQLYIMHDAEWRLSQACANSK
ncbi:uncharacterized protein LOC124270249 [Haliotis rubra]|uniref:uncharacterized protein LOC124270249 n=1 Tax=Haliotis rubra TaxID=36100 RepID=UPI001EE59B70|nr:uncharacterized protein LOC124270249 [Haliotis rubra]